MCWVITLMLRIHGSWYLAAAAAARHPAAISFAASKIGGPGGAPSGSTGPWSDSWLQGLLLGAGATRRNRIHRSRNECTQYHEGWWSGRSPVINHWLTRAINEQVKVKRKALHPSIECLPFRGSSEDCASKAEMLCRKCFDVFMILIGVKSRIVTCSFFFVAYGISIHCWCSSCVAKAAAQRLLGKRR